MLHGHLTHLPHFLLAASPGEQRQVVAPHLRVVAVTLQSSRQRVQSRFQTLRRRPTKTQTPGKPQNRGGTSSSGGNLRLALVQVLEGQFDPQLSVSGTLQDAGLQVGDVVRLADEVAPVLRGNDVHGRYDAL